MKGISKKEMEIVSWIEFNEKYFFVSSDIDRFVKNKTQRYNVIKNLVKKERIIKISKRKYYLVPIKAKNGKWSEHPFIIADEACDGKDYFINGWSAANHWELTEQIPMQVDIYTTRRQGKIKIMNTKLIFHRTTPNRIKQKSIVGEIQGHKFRVLNKKDTKKWLKKSTQ
jgi:predicted transcriptional regulator of viral defense system